MFAIITVMFGFFGLFGSKGGDIENYMDKKADNVTKTVYQFTMNDIDEKPVDLSKYKGKVILIVNVASKCGHTPQYEDLQALYDKNKDKNFVILGFPANNFLSQEPGTDADIKTFCTKNYGVTFPMFSKISVKGKDMAPLYKFLTTKEENGVVDAPVKWNFQKFLIDKEGRVVTFFSPGTKVTDKEFTEVFSQFVK